MRIDFVVEPNHRPRHGHIRMHEGVEAAATGRPKVATEMALHVLAYNLTRVMNIIGIKPLMAAIQA